MNLDFESDYRSKVLMMSFREPFIVARTSDVLKWRSRWTQELKSWHSPYKALIDCTNLNLAAEPGQDIGKSLETMMAFLKGFFLKNAVGFGYAKDKGHDLLPFEVLESEEEARKKAGIRTGSGSMGRDDLRSRIMLDNHFKQHVVEVTFSDLVHLETETHLKLFSDKLTNNLMQWHSGWSLLIDCSKFKIEDSLSESFAHMEKRFKGFFLKKLIGYSPITPQETYPFKVFRSRHRAAAELESEGLFSGEDADCQSRKQSPES